MTATSSASPAPRTPTNLPLGEVLPLGAALGGHANALGLLRLVLAALVMVDHAFPLGGFGEDPMWEWTKGQASFGSLAVAGFFAISGYLIAKSGVAADVVQFLWRRVLRIFPAYWLVLLVAALLVGPLVWILGGRALGDYFTLAGNGPVAYLAKNWTLQIGTYGIYDIFAETTPYGRSVGASVFNGSLWTLSYEFLCYLVIAVLVVFGVLRRARALVPVAVGVLVAIQFLAVAGAQPVLDFIPVFADPQLRNLMLAFLIGSAIAMYSKEIVFDDRLGVLAGIVFLGTLRFGGFLIIGVFAFAYFLLYLAARLPAPLKKIGQKNDYSYGVYVYGFLMQQLLAFFGAHTLGYVPYLLLAMVPTFALAWLSWHGVEKRAMALKDRGPGRGWRHWYDKARDGIARRRTPKKDTAE